jgi:hypothetical protein
MTPPQSEAAARAQVRKIVSDLEDLKLRLLGVQASLPEPAAESLELEDEEDMDPSLEMRSVISCVLNDSIGPAIRDLRDVADPPEGPR